MKQIIYYPETGEFHLSNDRISYLMKILRNGHIGHVYFGARLPEKEEYGYFMQLKSTSHTSYLYEDDYMTSLEHARLEYPCYGTTDYRVPAFEICQENGSRITDFRYESHRILHTKPVLEGLPALYTETEDEALTLEITLRDSLIGAKMILSYTIYEAYDAIARNVRFINEGDAKLHLTRALSLAMDMYDADFDLITLDGAWARERFVNRRTLGSGLQGVYSARGCSSAEHNPFFALAGKNTTENMGEAYGFTLVYSGNFEACVDVDRLDRARVLLGINSFQFDWLLAPGESFQTPEAVAVFSPKGLNGMSQTFHSLFNQRLVRGPWRGKERPMLLNNWEGTYFNFNEEKILEIAKQTKELGLELFVLDDGWFGKRDDASSSLGDWYADKDKLSNGIGGLAQKVRDMGLSFGLWIEPEMVNRDSELYRKHPEWAVQVPGRHMSHGRGQYVLDFSNPEVVDYIFEMLSAVFREGKVDYVKWDMNRDITEPFGGTLESERQGEFFHRYILGVYRLYEMFVREFPDTLFESCASGGARFDAGMLYYAPQAWTSDDTDAVERLKIQYGSTFAYPVSSVSAHVSAVPNHQLSRITPLKTRAEVAYFGDFGYELDPGKLTDEEKDEIRGQVSFYKKYRKLFQFGTFYRLLSPFDRHLRTAWMVVSEDKKTAAVASYKTLSRPNPGNVRIRLEGLIPEQKYRCSRNGEVYFGEELMKMGFLPDLEATGATVRNPAVIYKDTGKDSGDFTSQLYLLEAVK